MKNGKLFVLCAILAAGLILVGCEKEKKEKSPETTTQAPATSPSTVDQALEKAKDTSDRALEKAKVETNRALGTAKEAVTQEAPAASEPAKVEAPAAPAAPAPAKTEEAPKATPEPAKTEAPKTEAAAGEQKSPWAGAKVGDMAKYKGMGGATTVYEVVANNDKETTLKVTMTMGETAMEPTEIKVPVSASGAATGAGEAPKAEMKEVGAETVKVGDKELKCKVMESKTTMGDKTVTTKTWLSDEVPGKMVKTESDMMGNMQVVQELVDFKKQ